MAESIEDRITRLVLSATDTEGIHVTIPAHALNREMHDIEATARREERERCAGECMRIWHEETDVTKQNGLSHGCVASAAAIRALGDDESERGAA